MIGASNCMGFQRQCQADRLPTDPYYCAECRERKVHSDRWLLDQIDARNEKRMRDYSRAFDR